MSNHVPKNPEWNARKESKRRNRARMSRNPVPKASTPREAQLLGVPFDEWRERPHGFRARQERV